MVYFIVNKTARTGKSTAVWAEVEAYLESHNVSYRAYMTEYKGHAAELAKEISKLPYKSVKLVVVGGDGTVNEVINGIRDFDKVMLGVIPAGSGNDFAKGVGLSFDVDYALEKIVNAEDADRIDLGRVTYEVPCGCVGLSCKSRKSYKNTRKRSRLFAISAGAGLDAIVCKKALSSKLKTVLNRFHLGKLTYILLTVETLFSMDTARAKVRFDNGYKTSYSEMIFSAAMNLRAEGGGVPMAPSAENSDGRLDLCTAYGVPQYLTFFALPFLCIGKHENLPGFKLRKFRKCDMLLSKPMVLHADGEYCGVVRKLSFSCETAKLKLIK